MRTIQAPQRLVSCGREWRKRRLRGPIGFYPPAPKPKSSWRERVDDYIWETKRVWVASFAIARQQALIDAQCPIPRRWFWREPGFSWKPYIWRYRYVVVQSHVQKQRFRAPSPSRWQWTPGIAYMPYTEHVFATLAETTSTDNPLSSGATTMNVTTRTPFPQAGKFYLLVQDSETSKTNREIMRVTGGHGTGAGGFTVTRGEEGTTGVAHATGSYVALVVVATQFKLAFVQRYGPDITYYTTEAGATAGTDATAGIQAQYTLANTATGGRVVLGEGFIRLSGSIAGKNQVSLIGEGLDATIIVRDDTTGVGIDYDGGSWNNVSGDFSGPVALHNRTVNFASALGGGFAVGQDCKIHGGTFATPGNATSEMPSFISRIEALTSTSITFAETIPWQGGYPTTDATHPTRVSSSTAGLWNGFRLEGFTLKVTVATPTTLPTNATQGIRINNCKDVYVQQVKAENFSSTPFYLPSGCRNVQFRNCHAYRAAGTSGAYGFYCDFGTRINWQGCYIFRCGQGIVNQYSCYGQVMNCQISSCYDLAANTGIATDSSGRGIKFLNGHSFGLIGQNTLSDDTDCSCRLDDAAFSLISMNVSSHSAGLTSSGGSNALEVRTNTVGSATYSRDNKVIGNTFQWIGGRAFYCSSPFTMIQFDSYRNSNQVVLTPVEQVLVQASNCDITGCKFQDYGTPSHIGLSIASTFGNHRISENRFSNGGSGTAISTSTGSGLNQISDNYTVGEANSYHSTDTVDGWRTTRLTSDVSKTTTALTDVTGLFVYCAVSEVMRFEFLLNVVGGTGGVKLALTFPAGATLKASAHGNSTGVAAFTSSRIAASATLTTEVYCTSITGQVRIWGEIRNSTTAGNIQLGYGSGTSGQTANIQADSHAAGTPIK
jgi:hypothetical protein